MFRAKTLSTITSSSLKSLLQNRDSLFRTVTIKRRNSDKSVMNDRSNRRNKQNWDVEQSVTLGKVYLIVHLCSSEINKRELIEPDIFNPVRFGYEKARARYLINCLLRDNRVEFENELNRQNTHIIIVGIRMALRNCVSNVISYDNYMNFVKHEQEYRYDPNYESFNYFLSYLPRKNKGILIELFDLFAMIMENSHVNQIHPKRILKSMSLHIFNESQTKNYEDFRLSYQDWLKYSNATIHLFLSYLRERARSTKLPDRLNLLLRNYVECRKKCFTNSIVGESEKDIVLGEHALPDITIADLDEIIISKQNFNNNSVDSDSISIYTQSSELFPELMESLAETNFKSFITINDLETAKAKWKELQDKGLNILSEEVLKLFLDYDDINSNLEKKQNKTQRKEERFNISKPLSDKNENIKSDYSSEKESHYSTNIKLNAFSFTSTISDNSTKPKFNLTSSELLGETKKQKKSRKTRIILSLLCFKCYMYTDDPNYLDHSYEDLKEKSERSVIEPHYESELDKNQFLIQKKFSNSTDKLSSRISLSSACSPILPPQQFDHDIGDKLTKPQMSSLERSTTPTDPYKSDVDYRRFCRLYQEGQFNHENQSSHSSNSSNSQSQIGYISLPISLERQESQYSRRNSIMSSNMSECSSKFGRQSIIRGKELPYPITPLRAGCQPPIYHSGRQSPMRVQQYSRQYSQPQHYLPQQYSRQHYLPQQYSRQHYLPQQYFRQHSQNYLSQQNSQQYSQHYLPQQYFQQYPQQYHQQFPKYPQQHQQPIYLKTNTDVTVSTRQNYKDDNDGYDDIEPETVEDYDTPYQSQLYTQQEDVYYQHSQEE